MTSAQAHTIKLLNNDMTQFYSTSPWVKNQLIVTSAQAYTIKLLINAIKKFYRVGLSTKDSTKRLFLKEFEDSWFN